MPTKTELVKEELAKNPNPTTEQIEEIAKKCDCSKALVYKCLRKMPKPIPVEVPTPVEPVVTVKEEAEREVPTIEAEEVEKAEVVEEVKVSTEVEPIERLEKIEVGMLTEEDLTYVWQSVNQLFPEKHQRPDRSMRLLGKLWMKPANRLMEKYATENIDLYLAIGGTVLVFAPSIIGMIRERRKKGPKPPKEE